MLDIEGFREYLYEEELSENTISTYIHGVEQYGKMFDEISKPNLIAYKKYLTENFKPQTVNLRITGILRYCKYKNIPMTLKLIKEPKRTHIDNVISEEQYEKLVNGLKADGNTRWYVNITLLAKTGMRIFEAVRVTKKDLLAGSVAMHSKAHMREIYFPKSLVDDIMPYLNDLGENDLVIRGDKGNPLTDRGVDCGLKRLADKYGIPREVVHAHSFRHFFALEFIKRNNNIALLADILGHSNVNITQIYLRQSQEQQQDAVDNTVDW